MVELIHDYLYIESIEFFKSEDFAFFEKRLDIISPGFVRDNSNGPSLNRLSTENQGTYQSARLIEVLARKHLS